MTKYRTGTTTEQGWGGGVCLFRFMFTERFQSVLAGNAQVHGSRSYVGVVEPPPSCPPGSGEHRLEAKAGITFKKPTPTGLLLPARLHPPSAPHFQKQWNMSQWRTFQTLTWTLGLWPGKALKQPFKLICGKWQEWHQRQDLSHGNEPWVRLAKGKGSQENGCCMWFLLEFYVYCFQSPVLLTAEYQNNAISKLSLPCNYLLLWLLTLSLFQLTATHSPFPPWSNWSCAQLPSLQQIFAPLSCAPDAILNIRYGLVQISMIPNLTKFSL